MLANGKQISGCGHQYALGQQSLIVMKGSISITIFGLANSVQPDLEC